MPHKFVHFSRIFVWILQTGWTVKFIFLRKHSTMEDTDDQDTVGLLPVKHDMFIMFVATQPRADFVAKSPQLRVIRESRTGFFKAIEVTGGLTFAPSLESIFANAEQVPLRSSRKANCGHS